MRRLVVLLLLLPIAAAAQERRPGAADPAQQPPALPCSFYAEAAFRYAEERNLGYTAESRLAGLTRNPAANQAVLATARRMIADLWRLPLMSAPQAARIARDACGWPRQLGG